MGSVIYIKDLGKKMTGNAKIVIHMAKYDEEAKALSDDDVLAAKLMFKFLDVKVCQYLSIFFPVQNPLMACPIDNFSPLLFLF